ncbi:MAG: anaerobic sulfatase maturase [Atopobiaceae bacterium]|nr:anaerobic sulfatase maturase [Atopobiaceae bacterium]
MDKPHFAVMVKPIGSVCNMRCSYCYYLSTAIDVSAARMDPPTLEQLIKSYIEGTAGPVLSFTWHGGEPTLAGLPFFRTAVELQKRSLPEGWECWNSLQTNGLELDDEWCDFIAQNHWDVGLSIDGTRFIHDTNRRTASGGPTYERVSASIERLKERGIKPDLLCTVTSATAQHGREVYRALRDFGTGWMQFIPIVVRLDEVGTACGDNSGYTRSEDAARTEPVLSPESVSPMAYGRFLKDVFFEWFYHDMDSCEVQLFSEMALVLAGREANLCWMRKSCGEVPVVERDGGVYACDHFVADEHRIGSVFDGDLGATLRSEAQRAFGSRKRDLLNEVCRSCPHLDLCHGGCPKDWFHAPAGSSEGADDTAETASGQGNYYLCEGLRYFFDYARPRLLGAMRLSAQGKKPDEIMRVMRERERELHRSVNRNDPCPCGSGLKFKNCCQRYRP